MKSILTIAGAFLIMLFTTSTLYACGACPVCSAKDTDKHSQIEAAEIKTFCVVGRENQTKFVYREGIDTDEL